MTKSLKVDQLGSKLWGRPSQFEAAEFCDFSLSYSLEDFYARQLELQSAYDSGRLTKIQGNSVAQFILRRKQKRTPTSCIRISDGEGNLLPLAFKFEIGETLVRYCTRKISYMHFGDASIVQDNAENFGKIFRRAIERSDLLGFPNFPTIERGFNTEEDSLDVRAVAGNRLSYLLLNRLAVKNKSIRTHADAWFSRGLLPFYSDIVSGERCIGLISVYPQLSEKLKSAFGIPDINFIEVPRQAIFMSANDRSNTHHYPEGMERITTSIPSDLNGRIFFVAAGLLGKHYCSEVKNRGGIAIDIGSVAEIWLGIQARGLDKEFIAKWSL